MTFLGAFLLGCGVGAASMIWFCALMSAGARSDDRARADYLERQLEASELQRYIENPDYRRLP